MDIVQVIIQIVAGYVIVHSVSHIILCFTNVTIGYGCLPAYLLALIVWLVAPGQMVPVAFVLFLLFLPIRAHHYRTTQLPRDKRQAHTQANIYQQIQDHWQDARVIKVRGYAFSEADHTSFETPTLFVPADSPVLSHETTIDGNWQIDEFNFLYPNISDRPDLNIYLALKLRVGKERFVLPIKVAESHIGKLELKEQNIQFLHALSQAKHLNFTAFSEQWSEEMRRGKYKNVPSSVNKEKLFYDEVISPNKHYTLEIPSPSIQVMEAYITNHEMNLRPQRSHIHISFNIRDYRIEYVQHDETSSIGGRLLDFLFMPLPPY